MTVHAQVIKVHAGSKSAHAVTDAGVRIFCHASELQNERHFYLGMPLECVLEKANRDWECPRALLITKSA